MWNLIYNNLKIFIDPFIFMELKNLEERIILIGTLRNYLTKTDPSLCEITFFYPEYIEKSLDIKRTFFPSDKITLIKQAPETSINLFSAHSETRDTLLGQKADILNNFFSLAIQNKCVFYLTENEFDKKKKLEIKKKYGIQIVNLKQLYQEIESYLQGFYNYFKFRIPIYGIESPDIAHAMSDEFYNGTLIYLESEINENEPSDDLKERIRSFVHNRYIDILVTIDQINFFKLQERIYNVENDVIDNKEPRMQGYIRYYLNYYLFLLWGALDHLAWIINDIFALGYNPNKGKDRWSVGLYKSKEDFLKKIKEKNEDLYNFITEKDFQEWMFFFGQLRHKNAHREMFSASPLLITTKESKISDEEIDRIIYKDKPLFSKEIEHIMSPEIIQNKKIINRINYKISKMKKGIDHFALIEKDGKQFMFNPVNRIPGDIKNIRNLIQKIFEAYKTDEGKQK